MDANQEATRQLLRAGPAALSRALGDPSIIRGLQDPAALEGALPFVEQQAAEPSFDVFDEGSELLVVSELRGVSEEQIRIYCYPAQVVVHLRGTGGRHCVPLPLRIDTTSVTYAFHNNILTIKARPEKGAAAA